MMHPSRCQRVLAVCSALALLPLPAVADQVIEDDLIVKPALCAGASCVNGEQFGDDTLRLKTTNVRIHFDDTSTSASFPGRDWRIEINESVAVGMERFAIEDVTAGQFPFIIEGDAPSNALYVHDDGNIGMGTSAPQNNLEIVDGNTPGMRLTQNGSEGATAITWDIAANEVGFFVRETSNGFALPFRVFAGSASNSLVVRDDKVGINEADPEVALHVSSSQGVGKLLMQDTGGSGPLRMLDLENDGAVQLFMNNTSKTDASWLFSAGRSMLLSPTGSPADEVFELTNTGNLIIDGALTQSSDKTRKTAIEPVDPASVLEKVAAMPLAEWTYLHDEADGIRHIGPMAQDFHAAFGLGRDETGISSLDGNGVALAAIQALLARVETLEAELAAR
ncbi:tail fiber domain-containing protein [Jannaschia sp.]|nr:tail fiber domain-containing protein [Jannaschia sp.]